MIEVNAASNSTSAPSTIETVRRPTVLCRMARHPSLSAHGGN